MGKPLIAHDSEQADAKAVLDETLNELVMAIVRSRNFTRAATDQWEAAFKARLTEALERWLPDRIMVHLTHDSSSMHVSIHARARWDARSYHTTEADPRTFGFRGALPETKTRIAHMKELHLAGTVRVSERTLLAGVPDEGFPPKLLDNGMSNNDFAKRMRMKRSAKTFNG
jgi:hypothetical protein